VTIPPIHLQSGRSIGGNRVFIIAEVGSNHTRSLEVALAHIQAAAAAGADAVKFQSIDLHELYHQPSASTVALHERIDLPEEWHAPLKECCEKNGVVFLSTPTYLRAIDVLESVATEVYKLASAQVGVYPQLVQRVAELGKPVILSTGLVTEQELERVVTIFRNAGNDRFVVLHCNSVYPAPPGIVHMPRMSVYRERFGCLVGFSDHTETNVASVAAVALGASVIERHFTLSRKLDSPDAPLSLEPGEFASFVGSVREAEQICLPGARTSVEADEAAFCARIRHCLLSTRPISAGELLDAANTALKRGNGDVGIDAWTVFQQKGPLVAYRDLHGEGWLNADDFGSPVAGS
jgi:sialic acid synthase SpsE